TYMLLTRPSPQLPTLELRFQFRYSPPQPPRLLKLDPQSLWFSSAGSVPIAQTLRHKVNPTDVSQALSTRGGRLRYSELRHEIMQQTECSKRTARSEERRVGKEWRCQRGEEQYKR